MAGNHWWWSGEKENEQYHKFARGLVTQHQGWKVLVQPVEMGDLA